MNLHLQRWVGLLGLVGASCSFATVPVQVEVTFRDYADHRSGPVRVMLPVGGDPKQSIVTIHNPSDPAHDMVKLSVSDRKANGSVTLLAEEYADDRVVKVTTYTAKDAPGEVIQWPTVADAHDFRMLDLAVGQSFSLSFHQDVMASIRRLQ